MKAIGWHFLGWLLFFSLIVGFVANIPDSEHFSRVSELSFLLFFLTYVCLFYLNASLLIPKVYLRQKEWLYYLLVFALFALVFRLKPYENLVLRQMHHFGEGARLHPDGRPSLPGGPPFPRPERKGRILDIVSVVLFLAVWSVSMALQLFRQWRTTERRALQAEAEKVNAELSFLKAQINPHFFVQYAEQYLFAFHHAKRTNAQCDSKALGNFALHHR